MEKTLKPDVVVVANSVLTGDATGRHVSDVIHALADGGFSVALYYDGEFARHDDFVKQVSHRVSQGEKLPDCDVIIVEYSGWYPLAEAIRGTRARSAFWYHGVTPPDLWATNEGRDYLERSVVGCALAASADAVLADSPFGADEISSIAGIGRGDIAVVPIPVEPQGAKAPPKKAELAALRVLNGLRDKRILLFVGRYAGNKRIDLLVTAMGLLTDRFPDLVLLVIGDDRSSPAYAAYARQLRHMVAELHLQGRVRLLGRVSDVVPYYLIADVLALPSMHEGFGLPLLEAMQAGVPVVASDSGAMPWVLGSNTEEPAGVLFEPGSAEQLAEAIASILSDRELADSLRARGLERIKLFSPEVFREATCSIVHALARMGKRKPEWSASDPLVLSADVALRDYSVRSRVPVLGGAIEWIRTNLTTHVKEAYVDRVIERQVVHNLTTVGRIIALESRLARQSRDIEELRRVVSELSGLQHDRLLDPDRDRPEQTRRPQSSETPLQ